MSSQHPVRYVLPAKAAELTGDTVKAISRRIEEGVWLERVHWLKAPNGRRYIDIQEVMRWIEGKRPGAPRA